MSFSIDNVEYTAYFNVRHGMDFPGIKKNITMHVEGFGLCNIYTTKLGKPEWNNNLTISIKANFYITEIIEPTKEYEKQSKVTKLTRNRIRQSKNYRKGKLTLIK